jgi:acyl-CoA reductase-like NAD-dependent aldehyde dehydrogenase
MSAFEHPHPPQYPIYLAGNFVTTSRPLDVVSPFSGKTVYRTFYAGQQEFESAVDAAMDTQQSLQEMPVFQRYEILQRTAQGIAEQRDQFATIMAREAGKPIKTAAAEVERAIQTFLIAAEEAKRLPAEILSLDWHPSGIGKDAVVKYFPVGLIAGIAPFNFPLNLVAHKIAPAIAAGCPIVLKPASKTPVCALLLAKIIDQAGLPKGALSVLPMDRQTGNQLVSDERFSLLSFTGSPQIGWQMKQHCGKKKVVLELGGNAALIIDKDVDVAHAVSKALIGAFSYAGQSCIHTQRIYVEESIYDAFIQAFLQGTAQLVIGDPESDKTDMSSMIDESNAQRIETWVNEALQGGATLLAGGARNGAIYQPTVLSGVRQDMKVCAMEAFAPIVVIERFTDFKAAVDLINDSDFGLQAGVFTFDSRKIHYAFNHLHVGGVVINDVPTFRADHMPYGGVKDSGLGREGPKYAIMEMLEPRVLISDHNQVI